MIKKIMSLVLCFTLLFSLTACNGKKESDSAKKSNTISAEKKIVNVEITLPASLTEEMGDEDFELNEEAKEIGIKKITKNEDGSVTMKMSKKAHKELLSKLKTAIDESIAELLADKETVPSFNNITYNDDLTEVTIQVDPELYGSFDSFYALAFYMYGNFYQAVNGVPENELKTIVNFVDMNSGEILNTGDSSKIGESESE